jgi:tetratricopeptide (TPR) repeat protein
MAEDKADEIARLLRQGLDAYGDGNVAEAIEAWRGVLSLDPENAEALDFIETADGRKHPPPAEDRGGDRSAVAQQQVIEEARRLIAERQFEESFELLQRAAETGEFSLDLEATVELVRANLFTIYRRSIGDLKGVPSLAADRSEITKFNLAPDAGFLLSLVDGVMDLESLVTVSGMDAFEALRTTKNLIEVGIVRMQR